MTGEELGYAQRTLSSLRASIDSRLDRVVRSNVQGEGVAKGLFCTASSDPNPFNADRYWPEPGWPAQLEERYNAHRHR